MRRRREKIFGHRPIPLDGNGKARVKVLMLALMRRTEPGRAYGALTAKAFAVGMALLYVFHNAASGLCFPSYEAIAEKAGCARSTVAEAIKMLERAGVLTWSNRIERVREWGPDLFGRARNRWRVVRTSNDYQFIDPKKPAARPEPSKSEKPTGTCSQELNLSSATAVPAVQNPSKPKLGPGNPLHTALARWETAVMATK